MRQEHVPAAVGLTVKSGWASVVLLAGAATSPSVVDGRRVNLSDPAVPESRQPYHAGFGTARTDEQQLARLVASVRRYGRRSVANVVRRYTTAGHRLSGAGLIVGSLIDPDRIANAHIRIHAHEGRLFRTVVEDAVRRSGLACSIWRERDLYPLASDVLKRPDAQLRRDVAELGRGVGGSWRAEEKAAVLAAWLVLASAARAVSASSCRAGR